MLYDRRTNKGAAHHGVRVWLNGDKCAAAARRFGGGEVFKVVEMENFGGLSLRQQAGLFQAADVFFCPHGAHMANSVFMRPGSTIVEMSCGGLTWMRPDYLVKPLGLTQFCPRGMAREDGLTCPPGPMNQNPLVSNFTLAEATFEFILGAVQQRVPCRGDCNHLIHAFNREKPRDKGH